MNMMRWCIDWMMSLGIAGMLLGVLLLAALVVLVAVLIKWGWRRTGP